MPITLNPEPQTPNDLGPYILAESWSRHALKPPGAQPRSKKRLKSRGRTEGLGFGVLGLGFRVSGLGFGVLGLGFRVSGLGFGVLGLGFRVSGLGFGVLGLGFRVSGLGFGVLGLGFRVSG